MQSYEWLHEVFGKFKGFFCLDIVVFIVCFHVTIHEGALPQGHTSGFEDEEPMASTAI